MAFQKGHKINKGKGHLHSEESKLKISNANKGKKFTDEHKQKLSEAKKGNKYCLGRKLKDSTKQKIGKANLKDNAGHDALHFWVIKRKGKASEYLCTCGKQAYEWSNKDHSYKRNLDDYQALCRSCHRKWDVKYNGYEVPANKLRRIIQ